MGKKKRKTNRSKTKPAASSGFPAAKVLIIVVATMLSLVAGVFAWFLTRDGSSDIVAKTSVKLPSFAYDQSAPQNAPKAYQFAIDRPDLLSQVPCYCGCGQDAGHKSNLDCFIKERNGDKVLFDRHGAG